jgi:hypothetical protein
MLDILKEKLLAWSPEATDQFYKGLPRYSDFANTMWEDSDFGFFTISPQLTAYYGFNGLSYVLQEGDRTKELEQKLALANYSYDNDLIKLEKPVSVKVIEIYGIPHTYSTQLRPYRFFGVPCANLKYNTAGIAHTVILQQMLLIMDQLVTTIDLLYDNKSAPIYPADISFFNICYNEEKKKFFLAGNISFNSYRQYSTNVAGINEWLYEHEGITVDLQTDVIDFIKTQCTTLHLSQ